MDEETKVTNVRPWTARAYGWKALSPFVFAMAVILGIALQGTLGLIVVVAAFLNLIYGISGWSYYVPGQK